MEQTLALPHGLLAWEELGSRTAATTLVLLHGFPHDRGLFAAQIAAHASMSGVRLLVPDLPGFGRSTPLATPHMDSYADAVVRMLDAAGVHQAVIGGLSMGGYIAFAFWRRHPDRVRAMVLMDTKPGADAEAVLVKRRETIETVDRDGVGAVVGGMIPGQLGATTRASNPALVERLEVMLRRAPARGLTDAVRAMMTRIDSTGTLETITVPTLVIVGDEDTLTPPAESIAMAAAIPGARLVTVAGAGHLSPMEAPDVVNAALAEFLDVAL